MSPSGDIEAVRLEGRERLSTTEPGIVRHPRRRGQLGGAIRPNHEDSDTERLAPPERVEADHAGRVQDHEAAKAVSGPVVAADPSVLT
jgi:hypothetical protein